MNWLVQNNLIKEELIVSMEDACKSLGHNFVGVKIIPFTDSVEFCFDPFFKLPEGKFIPYGSTAMIKAIHRSKWDKSGFFFNDENLRTSKWVEKLGKLALNYDSQFMTLAEAMKLESGTFFMKPDNDLKDFTGSQVDAAEIKKFYDSVSAGGFCFGTDIPVVLSTMKNLGWEYRLFMIRESVISSSSYKLKTMVRSDKPVPAKVENFAREVARIWHPDDVYVMDVCETDDGLKVVEFNCFNASGFYKCDVAKIVREVSKFVDGDCCSYFGPPFTRCEKCGGRQSV